MDSAAMLQYYCAICLMLIIFSIVSSQPISSPPPNVNPIAFGTSLTAKKGPSSWKSPSGDFAFGFIQQAAGPGTGGGGGGYLLAIWYDKIPENTVIWSANRDRLAPEGSTLQLVQNGFVLNDPKGQTIWNASTRGVVASYGAILDTGNLVLASNTSLPLWQSFDTPTDSLLPSQSLIQGRIIVSSFSATNYSSGKFQLTNDNNANLVLYRITDPLAALNFPYYGTQDGSFGNNSRYLFDQSGIISLVTSNGGLINSVFSYNQSTLSINQYYQRLSLDYDGVLRHYAYPKSSDSTGGMRMAWSVLEYKPPNICVSNSRAPGGGVCGYNGLCLLGSDQNLICTCPDGYSFIDPNDEMNGCKRDFVPQSCHNNETESFELNEVFNCDWNVNGDYERFTPVTEDWCRQLCLNDCLCAAVLFKESACYKRYAPMINGRIDSSVQGKALIKRRRANSTSYVDYNNKHHKRWKVIVTVGSVLLGGSLLVNMLVLLATVFFGNLFKKKVEKLVAANPVLPGLNMRSFSYHELEEATNGFTEELGSGACSVVYKGTLKQEGMQVVAVKKLRNNMVKDSEYEFNAEVSSISRTNHKNLVQLVGYCNEGQHRLLVYEYMSNGSLASFLFDKPRPNWYKRVQIASTTASGLYYLHEECSTQIIHCDIKPQNVLLDESLTVKISDFGLAKLLKHDQTKTTTEIRGTQGYVAPEWFRNMAITSKVDVFSFGILLLEIVCCRKNIEINVDEKEDNILSDWAYDCYDEEKLDMLIANDEEALHDIKRVERFVSIALWCIQEEPSLRPSMKRVVQMLEGSIHVSVPPNPSSFISSIS